MYGIRRDKGMFNISGLGAYGPTKSDNKEAMINESRT